MIQVMRYHLDDTSVVVLVFQRSITFFSYGTIHQSPLPLPNNEDHYSYIITPLLESQNSGNEAPCICMVFTFQLNWLNFSTQQCFSRPVHAGLGTMKGSTHPVSAHSYIWVLVKGPWSSASSLLSQRYSHVTLSLGGAEPESPAVEVLRLSSASANMLRYERWHKRWLIRTNTSHAVSWTILCILHCRYQERMQFCNFQTREITMSGSQHPLKLESPLPFWGSNPTLLSLLATAYNLSAHNVPPPPPPPPRACTRHSRVSQFY